MVHPLRPHRARQRSGLRLAGALAGTAALFLFACASVPRLAWQGPPVAASAWSPRLADGTPVRQRPLPFSSDRVAATLDYLRLRCDPAADSIRLEPRLIVVHWTAIPTRRATWQAFAPPTLPAARPELAAAGRLNVSAHFLVDRDGRIDQLLPETVVARHVIGLNRAALGIENVGGPDAPLTAAQLAANEALVRHLAAKYPRIRYLIGHLEYRDWERSPLWEERDPTYRTVKTDPGEGFLAALRARLADLDLAASDGLGE